MATVLARAPACARARASRATARGGGRRENARARIGDGAGRGARAIARGREGDDDAVEVLSRRALAGKAVTLAAALAAWPADKRALAEGSIESEYWERVELPLEPGVILLDIAFVNEQRGFLLGTRQTILETTNGGKTWDARDLTGLLDDDVNYRFNSVSFAGEEGWIIGKPAVLLHTVDGGKNWERVGLSPRLPGAPLLVTAVKDNGTAEMVTDEGAIYFTKDAARNWKAAVEETVSATLNRTVSSGITGASYYTGTFSTVSRNDKGEYLGLSSRGNFYMTWAPGQAYWQPHNRTSARRVQSMGWRKDGGVWELTRGGGVFQSQDIGLPEEDSEFVEAKIGSRGFGLLDLGSDPKGNTYWAVGGSGSVFYSTDGGKSWKRDRGTDNVAANLYNVKFQSETQGFILGNDGVLLRYIGRSPK
ncbi:photosynthesis system II assembly factor YCF48-domain-containing protein [Ostreococcus tauri]|uniref:Photosynthesis system II assembly factor YCF48-domain-containing protein n=1 Tax=Ostreococcus tauri TaxID=70448 RepID=A0A1Y5I9G5_OSTTA|nr:photosynthesis system II assembly factor YCF48-domain-containing protein [Ostreococcus tauri]